MTKLSHFQKLKLFTVPYNIRHINSYRVVVFCGTSLYFIAYNPLGCWQDDLNRAVPMMEGTDPRIELNYQHRNNAVNKCFQVARQRHMVVFAIQNGGQCFAAEDRNGFQKYGASKKCKGSSKGGHLTNNVYRITNPIKPRGLTSGTSSQFINSPESNAFIGGLT